MRIYMVCSKAFYDRIPPIKAQLESMGHEITLPYSCADPGIEGRMRGTEGHAQWKAEMIKRSERVISGVDSLLVLNFEKDGMENYIGGATFLEIYDAFRLAKPVYMMNDVPEGILQDELTGFQPVVLHGDLGALAQAHPKERVYNKLVRDGIPEIIQKNGETPITRVLEDAEYKAQLEKKLLEECNEVLEAHTPAQRIEELADMLEIVCALGGLEGASLRDILAAMDDKRDKRGGFSKRIFLEKVIGK